MLGLALIFCLDPVFKKNVLSERKVRYVAGFSPSETFTECRHASAHSVLFSMHSVIQKYEILIIF